MTSSPLAAAKVIQLSAPLAVIRKEVNHSKLHFLLLKMLTDKVYVPQFAKHRWVTRRSLGKEHLKAGGGGGKGERKGKRCPAGTVSASFAKFT